MTVTVRGGAERSPVTLAPRHQHDLSAAGSLRITLQAGRLRHRLGADREQECDLDLGCLYELADGRRGVVQYFGGLYGAFEREPFVQLETGNQAWAAMGENLFVNLDLPLPPAVHEERAASRPR